MPLALALALALAAGAAAAASAAAVGAGRAEERWAAARAAGAAVSGDDIAAALADAADAACAGFGRPRVALCLAGGARTLPRALVRSTLQQHVAGAFGGDVTTFAYIKLADARGDARTQYGATVACSEADAREALAPLAPSELRLERTDAPEPLPRCEGYTQYTAVLGGLSEQDASTHSRQQHNASTPAHFLTPAYQQSFLGQLRGNSLCMRMVKAHEAARNITFDWVIKARPDLAVVRPLKAHCLWDPTRVHHRNDYIYISPRHLAEALLEEPFVAHYSCNADYDASAGRPGKPGVLALEQWLFRRVAANGISMKEAGQSLAAAPLRPTGPGYPDVLCNFINRGSYGGAISLFVNDDGNSVPHRPDLIGGDVGATTAASANTTSDFCRAVLNNNPSNALPPAGADAPSAPDAVCGSFGRPKVAVCLAGGARTLPTRLLTSTIRGHVLAAFGGDAHLFAYLKLQDRRGDDREGVNGLVHAAEEPVRLALRDLGDIARVASDDIVLEMGDVAAGAPNCSNYTSYGPEAVAAAVARNNAHTSADRHAAPPEGVGGRLKSAAYLDSFLGQLENNRACMQLIEAHERKNAMRFDWVVKLRPDFVATQPLKPYCFWDPTRVHTKNDWLYLAPRALAPKLLSEPYRLYHSCHRDYDSTRGKDGPMEHWLMETLDALEVPRREAGREVPGAPVRPVGPGHPDLLCQNIERASFGGAIELTDGARAGTEPHRPDLLDASRTSVVSARDGGDQRVGEGVGGLCRALTNHNPANAPQRRRAYAKPSPR